MNSGSDMSDLSPESRALLGLEGPLDEPRADELDQRRLAIFAALGVPPPVALPVSADAPGPDVASSPGQGPGPSSPSSPSSPSPSPSSPSPLTPASTTPGTLASPSVWTAGVKLSLGLAAVGVLAVGAWLLTPRASDTPQADTQESHVGSEPQASSVDPSPVVEAVPPVTSSDDEAPALEAPGQPPAPSHPREATERATEPTALPMHVDDPSPVPSPDEATNEVHDANGVADEPAPDPLSEESMLVAAGEAQLRAGQAANALTLFDRALARHPRGTLRVEALAGRALALCRSGRMDAGVREAERFLAAYPRSPSAPRIREACGVTP